MTEKIPLTVAVIVKNEEKKLDACLESVVWAEEIVILDDMSTDRTVEIAQKYTDRIFQRAMDMEGRQRNFAYDQARNEWVLSLDADERVSPELAEEICGVVTDKSSRYNAYAIPIRSYLGKRWLRGAGHYGARIRLFRRDRFRYEEAGVHPKGILEGECGRLRHDIIHFAYQDISDLLRRFNRETDLEAEKWLIDGRRVWLPNILRKVVDRFLKNYFLKAGWRDGFLGFFMSMLHGLYQLMSYAKYLEKKRGKDVGAAPCAVPAGRQGRAIGNSPHPNPVPRGRVGQVAIGRLFVSPRANRSGERGARADKVVFIDRDGVINKDPIGDYVKTWEEFEFLPGALEALQRLAKSGYQISIVSNQAGIGDGVYSEEALREITQKMLGEIEKGGAKIHSVHYCLHGKQDGCECRKPKTGLFHQASQGLHFAKEETFFIGDKASDIQAGKDFGLRTILVRTGHGEKALEENPHLSPDYVARDLNEAVRSLVDS